jgi:glycosyltransferase involved in cell wall biosynthesis
VHLVLKVQHFDHDPAARKSIAAAIAGIEARVTLIDRAMSNDEARNLIRCCDYYLSLHRSEGFGRGPAEAMFFAKPVVATGWSGNMEYMNAEVSFPVGYRLVPVGDGEYLEGEDQMWAEADVGEATAALVRLVDDPALGAEVGARAQAHMRRNFSNRVLGRRYRDRFAEIAENGGTGRFAQPSRPPT